MAPGYLQQPPKRFNLHTAQNNNNNNSGRQSRQDDGHNNNNNRDKVLHGRVPSRRQRASLTPVAEEEEEPFGAETPNADRMRFVDQRPRSERYKPSSEVMIKQLRHDLNSLSDKYFALQRECDWLRQAQVASNQYLQMQSGWLYYAHSNFPVPPPPFQPTNPPTQPFAPGMASNPPPPATPSPWFALLPPPPPPPPSANIPAPPWLPKSSSG